MQRHREGQLSPARRRALSALGWLALAGSLTSSALVVRSWRDDPALAARPALEQEVAPAVALGPPVPARPAPAPAALAALEPVDQLLVVGIVRAEDGAPLAGARVRAKHGGREASTDGAGAYELAVPVYAGASPLLHFTAPGHEPADVALRASQLAFDAIQVDVALAPAGSRTRVTGRLSGPDGRPVVGETVQLQSPEPKALHAAVSDARGAFTIDGVRVDARYDLIVRPTGAWADHWERGVVVPPEGLSLDVELAPLGARRVEGRIVDAEGRPVSALALSLRSEGSRSEVFAVEADASGRFLLEGVPEGTLRASSAEPLHVIRGVQAGGDGEVEIVVDVGTHALEGRVVDDRGAPRAGVQLDLMWLHQEGPQRSSSVRRQVSDGQGRFRFEGLGPGPHRLVAGGGEPALRSIQNVVPGADYVELRL